MFAFDPDRRTNARLIVDCHRAGYLRDDDDVLDVTYGHGAFWSLWRPARLTAGDANPSRSPGPVLDYTALPFDNDRFDVVVFDPPYKLSGTKRHAVDDRYGVAGNVRWRDRHAEIRAGIDEAVRVAKRRGIVLVKCADQVCSGKVRWQSHEFAAHARHALGCELVDELHVIGGIPQPAGTSQKHAWRPFSTALILRAPS